MIKVTREEAIVIRNNLRGVNVIITNRQSKSNAKTYYTEDTPYVNRFLNKLRKGMKVVHFE